MRSLKWSLIASLVAFIFISCNPPPAFTQQGQVIAPPEVSAHLISRGEKKFEAYKENHQLSRHPHYQRQLDRVAKRLIKVIDMPQAKWEFVVFENPTPNAFALPGGKVGVHSGLFPITQNDAGLAAVVGHEIAHATLDHASVKRSRAAAALLAIVILDQVLTSQGVAGGGRIAAAGISGLGSSLGIVLPFARQQELQADRIGAIYMAQAGYDPTESVKLWKRFSAYKNATNSHKKFPLLRTHPTDQRRIEALQAFMPIALKQYRPKK